MNPAVYRRIGERWHQTRAAARSRNQALRFVVEFLALRLWMLVIGCFPIRANLVTARILGRVWWLLMKRHRQRALENLRPAFPERSERELREIARRSFEHFAQLYLVELVMMPRLVDHWSWARYVELGNLGPALRQLLTERGVIMVTPHFGNYELTGYTIARLGLPLIAVMRPLDNPLINEHLVTSRSAGGVTLLYKKGASANAGRILDSGGALCFIADQDAGRKGVFAEFFNRQASWYKSIGLLAIQHDAPIVVGAAHRSRSGFHYRIEVESIIQPAHWQAEPDRLQWITDRFAAALEALIRRHPEQYLWMHRRWKTRPKGERSNDARSVDAARHP